MAQPQIALTYMCYKGCASLTQNTLFGLDDSKLTSDNYTLYYIIGIVARFGLRQTIERQTCTWTLCNIQNTMVCITLFLKETVTPFISFCIMQVAKSRSVNSTSASSISKSEGNAGFRWCFTLKCGLLFRDNWLKTYSCFIGDVNWNNYQIHVCVLHRNQKKIKVV